MPSRELFGNTTRNRSFVSIDEIESALTVNADLYDNKKVKNLKANLALPSYVHGYSLAIQFMYDWFKSKFDKDFFRGGIYIDGKNVLDDYKRLNDYAMRNIVKGQNPRAKMSPVIEYDYDREGVDLYQAPPQVYLRRSSYQDAFFKDYDRNIYLGFMPRALRMDFNFKVRLNSRSQQLDTFNRMELYFRNGATQAETISVDFHVPKYIMLNIAKQAGFKIENNEIVDIISFIQYLNRNSDVPFLFKLRAINQHSEFFIRINDLYTHIAVRDKLQVDDGERDGKLDFNFHIEMNAVLTIPIPHYYAYYTPEEITMDQMIKEHNEGCVAIYSINMIDIPDTDENGWSQAALTAYQCEKGDTEIDITPIFKGDNPLSRAINHDLTLGISPAKYINIKLYRDNEIARCPEFTVDWNNMKILFKNPEYENMMHIVIYYDRAYINELEIQYGNFQQSRISTEL